MHIGITYDLRSEYSEMGFGEQEIAEFDRIETVEAIENALRSMGHETSRIGTLKRLAGRLSQGERWDLVFNIAEGMYGLGRESQVPALLDAYGIPYTFSDPLTLALSLHKGFCKRAVAGCGVPTPDFRVVTDADEIPDLRWPVIAKPVAGGTSAGISGASLARDSETLRNVCARLLQQFRQPVLVEEFLPGREFTAGIAGTGARARVLGVMEILLGEGAEPDIYSYENKRDYVNRVTYRLVEDPTSERVRDLALRVWKELNCRDAGRLDFRCDDAGQPQFLEVNPLAGLDPVHSDLVILCGLLGISHASLIAMIVESARERVVDHSGK